MTLPGVPPTMDFNYEEPPDMGYSMSFEEPPDFGFSEVPDEPPDFYQAPADNAPEWVVDGSQGIQFGDWMAAQPEMESNEHILVVQNKDADTYQVLGMVDNYDPLNPEPEDHQVQVMPLANGLSHEQADQIASDLSLQYAASGGDNFQSWLPESAAYIKDVYPDAEVKDNPVWRDLNGEQAIRALDRADGQTYLADAYANVEQNEQGIAVESDIDEGAFDLSRLDQWSPPPLPDPTDFPVPPEYQPENSPTYYYDGSPDLHVSNDIAPSQAEASQWHLQDAGISVEPVYPVDPYGNPDLTQSPEKYAVGIYEVYTNPDTGDIAGNYLHFQDTGTLQRAEQVATDIYEAADREGISNAELGDFATGMLQERGVTPEWGELSNEQLHQYDPGIPLIDRDTPSDEALDQWLAKDRELQAAFAGAYNPAWHEAPAYEERGVMLDQAFNYDDLDEKHELDAVLRSANGADQLVGNFDPANDVPPFYDEATDTGYWVGVLPSKDDPDLYAAGLLAVRLDPQTGEFEQQFAPFAAGDYAVAQSGAEHFLEAQAGEQNIERVFDFAQEMERANGQFVAAWQQESQEQTIEEFEPVTTTSFDMEM